MKKLIITRKDEIYNQKIEFGVIPEGLFICLTNDIKNSTLSAQMMARLDVEKINQLKKLLNENF